MSTRSAVSERRPTPQVSVIMPAFNGERYVAAAVETVLGQSLGDFELIVVDDGSTDGTLEALQTYAGDPRVRVLQQEHGGVAAARNRAISVATTPLVAFLDADDLWLADYLTRMWAVMQAAPQAVLAFGGWRYVDASGTLLPQVVMPFGADPERARLELPWRNGLIPSAVMARTASIRRVGGFDTDFQGVEDWDLWLRLLGEGPFVALRQVSTLYRAHTESLTENAEEVERARLRLNEKHHGAASGLAAAWPLPRRQAVGHTRFSAGLARLRARDVAGGLSRIKEALAVWPELAEEDEFYFELACAYQPRGFRGTGHGLDVQETAELVRSLEPLPGGAASRARAALAAAWTALVARDRRSARHFALQALRAPGFNRKTAALALLVRSALPDPVSRRLATWKSVLMGSTSTTFH